MDNNNNNNTTRRKNTFLTSIKGLDFSDIESSVLVITVSTGIHFIVLSLYVILVFYHYNFFYGYSNVELLPYSVFVDRRYTYWWVLLFIQLGHMILFFLYQWLADLVRYSHITYNLHRGVNIFYLVFDVFYILTLLFLGVTCNASWFADNICNDPRYCQAYGSSNPTLCKTELWSPVSLSPNDLYSRLNFTFDFWFSIGFLLIDIVQLINAQSFNLSVIRFLEYNS